MELYNFFTEMVETHEAIEDLRDRLVELKDVCHFVELVPWNPTVFGKSEQVNYHPTRYSIMGQIYGTDQSGGDEDIAYILNGIKYTWFDAFMPIINNLKEHETAK